MAWLYEGDWGNDLSFMSPQGDVTSGGVETWGASDLSWSSDGERLALLQSQNRLAVFAGDGLQLVREWSPLLHPISLTWVPGSDGYWNTTDLGRFTQTLELLDRDHLAVGLIEGNVLVVSLKLLDGGRVFLAQTAYRMSRRP